MPAGQEIVDRLRAFADTFDAADGDLDKLAQEGWRITREEPPKPRYWYCLIGPVDESKIPEGGYAAPRMAARNAVFQTTGLDVQCASAWISEEESQRLFEARLYEPLTADYLRGLGWEIEGGVWSKGGLHLFEFEGGWRMQVGGTQGMWEHFDGTIGSFHLLCRILQVSPAIFKG